MDITFAYSTFTMGFPSVTCCRRYETQAQCLGGEGPLEEGMATHSSILALRTWT